MLLAVYAVRNRRARSVHRAQHLLRTGDRLLREYDRERGVPPREREPGAVRHRRLHVRGSAQRRVLHGRRCLLHRRSVLLAQCRFLLESLDRGTLGSQTKRADVVVVVSHMQTLLGLFARGTSDVVLKDVLSQHDFNVLCAFPFPERCVLDSRCQRMMNLIPSDKRSTKLTPELYKILRRILDRKDYQKRK